MNIPKEEFKNIKAVAFDLDGVIYFGDMPADGAAECVRQIRNQGKKVFFITNNSAKSRWQIADKLKSMNIPCVIDNVITSGYAAATYLIKEVEENKRIFVLGTDDLKAELKMAGLTIINEPPCDTILVGFDKAFNYETVSLGLDAILSGAKFLVCNRVPNFPIEGGKIVPGLGAIVGALIGASQREPDMLIGKPNIFMLELMTMKTVLKPCEIVFVSDSLEDVMMANQFGSISILITGSGEKTNSDLYDHKKYRPKVTLNTLKELSDIF